MIRYLANIAILLHTVVRKTPFQWTNADQDAYNCLKKMITKVLVVQPPDWGKKFHVFVVAFDVAIGSAFMQLMEPNWYRRVYYASRKLSTVERNYSTIERKVISMIYSINKFQHYLLVRKFTFHVSRSFNIIIFSIQAGVKIKTSPMGIIVGRV